MSGMIDMRLARRVEIRCIVKYRSIEASTTWLKEWSKNEGRIMACWCKSEHDIDGNG
jgi:hypothetical protein